VLGRTESVTEKFFFFNAEGNLQTREKRGRQLKVCEKKEGGSESVTEKFFFLMLKATCKLEKKEGDN